MENKTQTIKTYNESARALAERFDRIGARIAEIEETFAPLNKEQPVVLEIGCGNGRDAMEILKRTNQYLGIDISDELIKLAKEKNPNGTFVVADIEHYQLPENLDAIFAFASLIHVPKESLKKILADGLKALNAGGVFRISMKRANEYAETTMEDEFGIRTYYLYSEKDIEECAQGYDILNIEHLTIQGQEWLKILLQKPTDHTSASLQ